MRKSKKDGTKYKLSDGARLRTKLTIGKVISPPGVPPERALELPFQHSDDGSHLLQSEHERNTKRASLAPQYMQNSVVEDLDFEQIKTSVNECLLENGICIKLRFMLALVGKT